MRRLDCTILGGFVGAIAVPLAMGWLEDRFVSPGGVHFPSFSLFVGLPVGLVLGVCVGAAVGSGPDSQDESEPRGG